MNMEDELSFNVDQRRFHKLRKLSLPSQCMLMKEESMPKGSNFLGVCSGNRKKKNMCKCVAPEPGPSSNFGTKV